MWSSPVSNRILLEAGFSGMGFSYGREKAGDNRDLIQVNDQVGPITYRSMNWRPAVSFTPLGDVTQRAMAFARFSGREGYSSVTPKYSELGILMVARLWTSEYVWNAHSRYAASVGLPAEVIEAIRLGKRPSNMEKDVEAIYNFANEFLTTKKVGDATFQAAKTVLGGDRGVVDLTGTMGLYQISSMMVVLDQTPLAEGTKPSLPPIN